MAAEPNTISARTGPYERRPTGGYRHASTARRASTALSIRGRITPTAPRSSARMISQGSFQASRASGTAPAAWAAWNIEIIVASSLMPCWRSTHT